MARFIWFAAGKVPLAGIRCTAAGTWSRNVFITGSAARAERVAPSEPAAVRMLMIFRCFKINTAQSIIYAGIKGKPALAGTMAQTALPGAGQVFFVSSVCVQYNNAISM